mmetsp:Transcript_12372/g.42887  ORF Transcript_12372/g.42887 Transcript_12372/m.42887 type:complete len:291 (+) Transcript_12372:1609-2481(+)
MTGGVASAAASAPAPPPAPKPPTHSPLVLHEPPSQSFSPASHLARTTTLRRTVFAALPAASETSYEMTYGLPSSVGRSVLTAPAPNDATLPVTSPSTSSSAVTPGSSNSSPCITSTIMTRLPDGFTASSPSPRIVMTGAVRSGGGVYSSGSDSSAAPVLIPRLRHTGCPSTTDEHSGGSSSRHSTAGASHGLTTTTSRDTVSASLPAESETSKVMTKGAPGAVGRVVFTSAAPVASTASTPSRSSTPTAPASTYCESCSTSTTASPLSMMVGGVTSGSTTSSSSSSSSSS